MKVNITATISIDAMLHLDKQKNKSQYINQLILKDVQSEQAQPAKSPVD